MQDPLIATSAVALGMVVIALVVFATMRGSNALRGRLWELATGAGWSNLSATFFSNGVRGSWRSFPVELSYRARQKSVPRRFVLRVSANTDSRIIIKRRFEGLFSNKPLFGPPLVETRFPELWVRADERSLIDRIFADTKVAAMIADNLVARFDEIRVDRKGLRITRALDERQVKTKYGLRRFFNAEEAEPIAREELALAEVLVEKLG